MKNLFRGLVFGFLAGVAVALYITERQRQAESESFANDPETQAVLAESRRLHNTQRWLDDLAEEL
jgi:hypothetical protein